MTLTRWPLLTGWTEPVVVEDSVEIARPPEVVFDYCTDLEHETEWNPRTRSVEKLTEGPVRLGTRFRAEWVKGDPALVEYVTFDRPVAWTTTGRSRRLHSIGEGYLTPTPDGCRLDVRLVMRPRGLLSVTGPLLARVMHGREHHHLAAVKAALER